MNINKQPYEISLWKDVWDVEKQCYRDKKVATIGKSDSDSLAFAKGVSLKQNVNGTSELTFTLHYQYQDEETGEQITNPFISMLSNERKVKLKYADKWDFTEEKWVYKWKDFFIKNGVKSSDKKSISYTCKDAFITELSKNGFSIELDTELENNQGTVNELGKTILAETDWKIIDETIIQQRVEDYLYEVSVANTFLSFNSETGENQTVSEGNTILIYYSSIIERELRLQFLYSSNGSFMVDDQRIVDSPEYYINATYLETENSLEIYVGGALIATILDSQNVSEKYKGMRLVRKPKTTYDPITDKYVTLYKKNNVNYYGYSELQFTSPLTVTNLVTNGKDMVNSAGWFAYSNDNTIFTPNISDFSVGTPPLITLKVDLASGKNRFLNTGVSDNRSFIKEGIVKGEKWVFRVKYHKDTISGTQSGLTAVVAQYNTETMTYQSGDAVFSFNSLSLVGGYAQGTAIASKSITQGDLHNVSKKYGLFLISNTNGSTYFLEDVQLFKAVYKEDSTLIYPEDFDIDTISSVIYSYYEAEQEVSDPDDIVYEYRGDIAWDDDTIQYDDDNYEKVRSITASKSNCFNLIQELAEIFDCWALFEIGHEEDGSLQLIEDAEGNWYPNKTVRFVEFLGQEQSLGFKYGINLQNIQRTVESEQIITKLIVEKNSNEYAPDGFCTISYAPDNFSKESFILNLDYFIQKRLLNHGEVLRDLYITIGTQKGYLAKLRELNTQIFEKQEFLPGLYQSQAQSDYLLQLYGTMLEEARSLKQSTESAILTLTKKSNINEALTIVSKQPKTSTDYRYYKEYSTYVNNISTTEGVLNQVKQSILNINEQIAETEEDISNLVKEKKILNLQFYKRYSRFLQEGSWIDEDYIDHNKYYLDAQSVLYNSAFPQVQYTINVIDLMVLDEYRHYTYSLGDMTTIEDVEFFGYSDYETRTPHKQKVIITEIVTNFDDPRNNKITIQNFKSQFQDLFQRITATTNSLQYNTGAYGRAAAVVTESGEIEIETLQNSLINNALTIASAQNESFTIDSNGITSVDLDNPLNIVKLQSKGLFLSEDGGITWKLGIRAGGINTQALTAGSILVDRILIQGSGGNAFRWNEYGINAYGNLPDGSRNTHSFVRFDNLGIYGIRSYNIDGDVEEYVPEDEEEVWDTAQFGMTWEGFFLKNKYADTRIEISTKEDISIYDGDSQKIKLGNLGTLLSPQYGLRIQDGGIERILLGNIGTYNNPSYGLVLRDATGEIGLYTDEDGKLFAQHLYIGPKTYDVRAEMGILEEYIRISREENGTESFVTDVAINEVEEYNPLTLYNDFTVISYQGNYYVPTNSFEDLTLMPIPGVNDEWTLVEPNFSKVLAIKDIDGEEQIVLYDNGAAVLNDAIINGTVNAIGGTIGGLTITDWGLQGFGFTLSPEGVNFDITTNSNGFSLYRRKEVSFNPTDSYLEGAIVTFNNDVYIALQDMIYDGIDETPSPLNGAPYWELSNETDPLVAIEKVFSVNNDELVMVGTGSFSGAINATSGSFSGEIYATRGYIGGLISEGGNLYSSGAQAYSEENSYPTGTAIWYDNARYLSIVNIPVGRVPLPGEDGSELYWEKDNDYGIGDANFSVNSFGNILANSIALGASATITDHLQLGNAFIYNPLLANHLGEFITIYKKEDNQVSPSEGAVIFSLRDDGILSIGENNDIVINGNESSIVGKNWFLTPTEASFSNVSVSGTIQTSIFKKNSVQSIDSTLVLAHSDSIQDFDFSERILWVELVDEEYNEGDWILVAGNNHSAIVLIEEIGEVDNRGFTPIKFIKNEEVDHIETPLTITYLGEENSFQLGINASGSSIHNLFAPKAITMTQLAIDEGVVNPIHKVILGKLNGVDDRITAILPGGGATEIYGLYSDFAYLRGSIVTESPFGGAPSEVTYAGLSTLHGVSNIDNLDDNSQIVIWAGAESANETDIQNAPFKVTQKGFLYAEQGIFKGSVISNSVITDSVIVAKAIEIDPSLDRALYIYDTDTGGDDLQSDSGGYAAGIIFAHIEERNSATGDILRHSKRIGMNMNGIQFYDEGERTSNAPMGIYVPGLDTPILDIDGNAILSNIKIKKREVEEPNFIEVSPTKIQNRLVSEENSNSWLSQIIFGTNGGVHFEFPGSRTFSVESQVVSISNNLRVLENLVLGSISDTGNRMSFQKVRSGYDLYVHED